MLTSKCTIKPSLEGVSMVSFTSWVCTDMRCTLASGLTKWRPEGSASGRTLPKRSRTPTCPAGTTRAERSSSRTKTTRITTKKAARGFTEANVNNLLREVGSLFWFIAHTFEETLERIQQGRVPFRAASFFRHTERAGVDSVPLVGLVSFFLGLTMALLTGYQLQRFGTERLIPGLVAIGFTRELGPLLTGIMMAARIGAAFTAELGTMQVSEEVEAIEAMGIGPLRFLVAPRMLALFLLMPCLSTVSNIAAIFASSLICKAYFSIAFPYFLDLVKDSLLIRDIITGILKSFLFGLLIGGIACYRGLTVKGGAAGVGTATTSSVVTAITAVIGFDTLYNIVYTTFYPT